MASSSASITSLGVGSGLDLESIVSALVESRKQIKRVPVDQKKALKEIEVSGLSTLKSSLTTFKDYIKDVKSGDAVNKRSVTTDFKTDETPTFTYETTSSVTNSSHDIAVTQLASGTKMRGTASSDNYFSEAGADGATVYRLRTGGSLTFTVGSGDDAKSFSVDIGDNSSLDSILKKVNSADGNPGVSLNYVVGSDGSVNFTLSSSATGDDNELTIGGDVGILGMTGDGSDNIVQHAQNAKMLVDGVEITSEDNNFDDQVSGLKLTASTLSEQNEDGSWVTNNLTISQDKESFKSFTSEFVSKFNSVLSTCDKLYAKNTYTDGECNYDGGDLAGDSICKNVKESLKSVINNFTTSTGDTLYSYGISIDKNGELTIDSDKLSKAVDGNYDQLISIFSDIGEQLDDKLEVYTKSSTGILAQRSTSANNAVADYDKRLNNIDEYLEKYESTMRKKFTNLDTLLSDMNSSLSYIQSIIPSS